MILYLSIVAKSWEGLSHSMAHGGCAAHAPLAHDTWDLRRGSTNQAILLLDYAAVLKQFPTLVHLAT